MLPPLTLQRDENREGQFVGSFALEHPASGVSCRSAVDRRNDQARRRPANKTNNARQNAQLLRLIASETGGEYFAISEASVEVPKRLPKIAARNSRSTSSSERSGTANG